jgi:hypothetical protein
MNKSELKELIREEYHNVKNFMEEKYGFTPELGKVVDNPYVSAFKNEATYSSGLYMILDKDGKVVDKGLKNNMWYSFEKFKSKGTHYIVSKKNLSKAQSLIKKYQSDLSNNKFRDSMFKLYSESVSTEALSDYEKDDVDYEELYKDYLYSKKRRNEGDESDSDMAVDQLEASIRKAQELITKLRGKGDLEPWVQSLITKAEDYISTVSDYGETKNEATAEEEDEFHTQLDKLVHKTFGKSSDEEIEEYDVENEQDIKEFVEFMREYSQKLNLHKGETPKDLYEAEYQGRKVELGKIMQGDVKKFKVYVNNDKGNVVKVNFGQKGMTIKKDNPGARKSFRARMNCDSPGPRWKARYWSCRKW